MKKIIALLATALFAASVYAGEFADISLSDVQAAATAKSAVIIDANPAGSYKAGHVPGALSWSAIKDNLAASLPADKTPSSSPTAAIPTAARMRRRRSRPRSSVILISSICPLALPAGMRRNCRRNPASN
jgi:hypothetical protein